MSGNFRILACRARWSRSGFGQFENRAVDVAMQPDPDGQDQHKSIAPLLTAAELPTALVFVVARAP